MKILHSADWHIGKLRDLPNYLDRQKQALDELVQVAVDNEVDVFLVVGDLFDSKNPKEEERNLIISTLSNALVRLPKTHFIIVEGNHDWNTQDISMLQGLQEAYSPIGSRISVVIGKPKVITIKDSNFVCIPCQQDLTKKKIKRIVLHKIKNLEGTNYVALHECMKSFAETGKEVGTESLPKLKQVKCWMLGDVHKHQFILPNAWYSGSLLQTDFGEKSEKGCVLVTNGKPKFIKITSPKRLVTIKQGEEIPDNCFVKYKITNPLDFERNKVKDNVVSFEQDIEKSQKIDLEGLTNVTDGLPELLATKFGASKKQQKKAVKFINKIVGE